MRSTYALLQHGHRGAWVALCMVYAGDCYSGRPCVTVRMLPGMRASALFRCLIRSCVLGAGNHATCQSIEDVRAMCVCCFSQAPASGTPSKALQGEEGEVCQLRQHTEQVCGGFLRSHACCLCSFYF